MRSTEDLNVVERKQDATSTENYTRDLLGYDLVFLLTPFLGFAELARRLFDFDSSSVRAPCGKTRSRKLPKSRISFASPPHQISCPTSAYVWKSMFDMASPSGGGSRRMAIDVSASECLFETQCQPRSERDDRARRTVEHCPSSRVPRISAELLDPNLEKSATKNEQDVGDEEAKN